MNSIGGAWGVHFLPYKAVFMAFLAIFVPCWRNSSNCWDLFYACFMVFWDANKARAKRFFLQPTVSEIFRYFLDPYPSIYRYMVP